jgi:hypothetical protein
VTQPALDVRLDLPERAASGDRFEGRLTIANTVSETVLVVSPESAAALTLVVFDRSWNVVTPEAVAKVHTAREERELAPGESLAWDLADLSFVSGTAQMRYSLPPGTYHVLAVYHPGTGLPEGSSYPIVAVSDVGRLEITEPKA